MRPVNLLPQKHRPHKPSGGKSGSSYMVLGLMALLLVAAVAYVMEANKITQAKTDIASAQQKTEAAKARAAQLGPFANFSQIKEQRVASVRQLAESRFDWERTVRELAHILPEGVWLRDFDAALTPADAGSGGAPTPGASSSGDTAVAGPSIKLHGCAYKQSQVAQLLVRLRAMKSAKDVKLGDSTRGEDARPDEQSSSDGAPVMSDSCGTHNKRGTYEFNAVVEFETAAPVETPEAGKTPVRLGGGS